MILFPFDGRPIELDERLLPGQVISYLLIGPINLEAWQCGSITSYNIIPGPCILDAGVTLVFDRVRWTMIARYGEEEQML